MRRVAANMVYNNDIEFHKNHIVELYNHIVVNHYSLQEEMPMTEWFGGTIFIFDKEAYHISKIVSQNEAKDIYDILSSSSELGTHHSCSYGHIQRL